MRHRLVAHVISPWRVRTLGSVRCAHELLEKQLNLKQPHELPSSSQRGQWNDEPLSWKAKAAFGALGLATVGALVYEFQRYQQLKPSAKRILDVRTFLPFTLIAKERVSSNCSIFTLLPTQKQKSVGDPYDRLWINPVWSVEAKQPQLQIARAYTPLPPTKSYDANDPEAIALRFMIREEDRGEMSGYLHRLGLGSTVELRGPKLECQIPPALDEVVFFAGGTGIAPALQLAHHFSQLSPAAGKMPRMQIVWSSRRREDCLGGTDDTVQPAKQGGGWGRAMFGGIKAATQPASSSAQQSPIVQELERLKAAYPGRLHVDYFVDEEETFVSQASVRQYLATSDPDQQASRKAVIVSGPDGYIAHMSGAKVWQGGQEQQGALGGLLRDVVPSHWTVIKL